MRVEFHGAARTVTGSCTLLESGGTRVLVDCGQFQGEPELEDHNRAPFAFDASALDAVVLTHAHVDHVGRAPLLLRRGFRGPFLSTRATAELATLMLLDAAHVQKEDHERRGGPEPAYEAADVEALARRTAPLRYGEPRRVGPGIEIRLSDAGHILGSAHVLATMTEGNRSLRFGISGDVGAEGRPVVGDPQPFASADVLQVETTYGDRDHRPQRESLAELLAILESVEGTDGTVIVPAFALGRTQDLLYHLNAWKAAGRLGRLKVYVDSPLATRLTSAFRRNTALFDDDARGLLAKGDDPFDFSGLRVVSDARESDRLDEDARGALIVASSGMCQGGRVVQHLAAFLPRPSTHVVIVGYQARGTRGRRLVDGAKTVSIHGREVDVRAKVHTIGGFSAHAGRSALLAWVGAVRPPPKRVFLVHGEPPVQEAFARALRQALPAADVTIPSLGSAFEL